MLDKKIYLMGMRQLVGAFNFDMDKDKMEIWYIAFEDYTPKDFKLMIKEFIKNSDYPPQAPHNVIKYYKKSLESQAELTTTRKNPHPDRAWAIVIQGIRAYGLSYGYEKFNDYVLKNGGPIVKEVASRFIRELEQLQVGDTFIPNAFKKSYAAALEEAKHEEISKIENKQLDYNKREIELISKYKKTEFAEEVSNEQVKKLLNSFKEGKNVD